MTGDAQRTGYVVDDDGVAVLRIARPPANALSADVVADLSSLFAEIAGRSDVGALVVTGSGGRFVAGGDIKEIFASQAADFATFIGDIQRCFDELEALPIPTVAAINGDALGGGLELALACDFRLAQEGVRVGVPEVRLGMQPGAGGTQRIVESIGRGPALDLLLTGRFVGTDEALSLGLVMRVVPADELLDAALQVARTLASGPANAHAAIKACVRANIVDGREAGLALEAAKVVELHGGPDAREGLSAFIEKRPPNFRHRRSDSSDPGSDPQR